MILRDIKKKKLRNVLHDDMFFTLLFVVVVVVSLMVPTQKHKFSFIFNGPEIYARNRLSIAICILLTNEPN